MHTMSSANTSPYVDVSLTSHRRLTNQCSGCGLLSIGTIKNCASISLRGNHYGLEEAQLYEEYAKTPPIILSFARIEQARSSCALCAMIFNESDTKTSIDLEVLLAFRCENLDGKVESVWIYDTSSRDPLVKIYCHAHEGSYASQYLSLRPISPARSNASITRIKCWIEDCERNHPECRFAISGAVLHETPALPTRILDVTDYPSSLRLVDSASMKDRYVALSHCWGGKSQLQTKTENLSQYQKHVPCAELSETVRNAAEVTKALGICYLWVDCLCIVQDDQDDFDRESRRMASVYENSYLTIAATAAIDGTGGLFLRSSRGTYVEVLCDEENPSYGSMYYGLRQEPEETVFEAPLNKRAWVLQEHLFASRTVHFASNQLYWECYKTFVGEDNTEVTSAADMSFPNRAMLCYVFDGFRGFRRSPKATEDNDMNKIKDLYSIWAQLIRYYSTRGLTNSSDKLPAIISLSLELERILDGQFWFHEGLMFGNLYFELQGLLWRAQMGASLQRPSYRRGPSWSWTSVDGPIDFADLIHENRDIYWFVDIWHPSDKDLRVLDVRVHQTPGIPSCKALLLNGVTLECFARRPGTHHHDDQKKNKNELSCVYNKKRACMEGELVYDVVDDQPDRMWLIPVFVRWRSSKASSPVYYCLMVKEAPDHPFKGRVFERVGAGMVFDVKWFSKCERGFLVLV